MADLLALDEPCDRLAAVDFDRPPALVSNAHVTGLAVARALDAHDVPVTALDRVGDGAAPPSDAVDYAAEVTYPLDDPDDPEPAYQVLREELGATEYYCRC